VEPALYGKPENRGERNEEMLMRPPEVNHPGEEAAVGSGASRTEK
jgi:hypothetical protein